MVTHDDREQKPAVQGPSAILAASPGPIHTAVCRPTPTRLHWGFPLSRHSHLAKPNYSFEKRQREIAKKKEKDEKDARKREAREAAKQSTGSGEGSADNSNDPSAPA
jgi:hypothetical protein